MDGEDSLAAREAGGTVNPWGAVLGTVSVFVYTMYYYGSMACEVRFKGISWSL